MSALPRLLELVTTLLLLVGLPSPVAVSAAVPPETTPHTSTTTTTPKDTNPVRAKTDAPGVPTWLTIPAVGVNAPVTSATRRRGVLAIPDNPRVAGWDASTVRPGARMGTTLIAGHRDTSSGQVGALRWIASLNSGNTIRVSTTTGTVTYLVTGTHNYLRRGLPASVVNPVGWHRLALVTCGGPLVRGADGLYHYRDNIVVWATPVR